jgi:tetratricopeptide (TPR) repeat protein
VAVYERLAQANPAAYEPDLALSLTNLSNRLAETGERSGGLQAIQRAVAVYERLAQANPAAYEPDLAGSLTNLSIRLAETGERSGGLKAIQRAIELIQPYAQPGTQFSDWLATMELILHRLKGTSDP